MFSETAPPAAPGLRAGASEIHHEHAFTNREARRGLIIVLLVGLAFFGSWYNRYAPPTTDGEAALMADWARDYLPYRDYFMQAPPGIPMLIQGITAVAGAHLLGTLTFGVLLRLAGACALYGLLLAIARPRYAALATLAALFVSSTDISDTPFYYNHVGASLILVGTYLGVAGGGGDRARSRLAVIGSGALLTFAIAVKQTMVFGSAAAALAMVLWLYPRPRHGWTAWLIEQSGGVAVTVGGIWSWLAWHHLVDAFLFVMRQAPDSKGGVVRSMLRPVLLLQDVPAAAAATIAAWVALAIIVLAWTAHKRDVRLRRELPLILLFVLVFASIRIGFWTPRIGTLFLTAFGWWGSLVAAALMLPAWRTERGRAYAAIGILSFGIGYCFAVSWPLFENIAFPGLAVIVAFMFENAPSPRRRWAAALTVLVVAAMGLSVYRKFTSPHSWGLWFEPPIYETRAVVPNHELSGLELSEPSANLYSTVARIAQRWTTPEDRIYVYPNMPILYAIAERRPATYALAHWVDVCPDFLGKEDAERLRTKPPKLMIIRTDPFAFVVGEERLYRGGRPSSVRAIVAAVNELAPKYDRVEVFRSAASAPILFLVRRDAGTPTGNPNHPVTSGTPH